ncbi:MAG: NAD(P)-dependent oxidoreductase [Chloroflexota bacterium]|nr:NAD(P)-dependent oxidoreductase [Chloroflexota bacterium]
MATLVTGLGYIGAALVRRLAEQGGQAGPIVALDNFYCTPRIDVEAALPDGVRLIEGDVAEARHVAHAFDALGPSPQQPHVVYHLAAQPSASVAVREPALTERSNLVGARVVLEAARERGARVVFGGSFRVYGDDMPGMRIDETTPYGRVGDLSHLSKVYTEQLGRMLGVAFVSVRLGVTYGLSPIMKTTPAFMTVPNLFCQRAADGKILEVHADRALAFIHVQDAAEALVKASARLKAAMREPVWEVVNAAPEVATIGQVARTVAGLMECRGGSVEIHGSTSAEATFQVRSSLAADGFQPQHTLANGLGDVLDFFRTPA